MVIMSRYDTVDRVVDKKITRIGTSDLPKFKEKNSFYTCAIWLNYYSSMALSF